MEIKNVNENEEVLRRENSLVNLTNRKELKDIVSRLYPAMVKLMRENGGCGIASPQVGINKKFFIAKLENECTQLFINPQIVKESEEKQFDYEGCLSIPNLNGLVERPSEVTTKFFNYKKMKMETKTYNGFNARIILHEKNHLDGILYTDIAKEIIEN